MSDANPLPPPKLHRFAEQNLVINLDTLVPLEAVPHTLKMMKNILFALALSALQTGFAQKSHELKISTIDPIFKMAHLSYEYTVSPRWGLELMLRHNWGVGAYTYPAPPGGLTQQVLTVVFSQRFYPFAQRHNWLGGWLVGAYLREDWMVSSSWKMFPRLTLFQEYSGWEYASGRSVRAGAGLLVGYKKRFGRHLFAEADLGYDLNVTISKEAYRNDIAGILGLKVGWRF